MVEGGDTIFGKIIRREIPAQIVHETESLLVFRDITPQAPTHLLVIPKKPVRDLNSAKPEDAALLGELLLAAAQVARDAGIAEDGYRVVVNTGPQGGQTVFHLHIHILGGRDMTWPPG